MRLITLLASQLALAFLVACGGSGNAHFTTSGGGGNITANVCSTGKFSGGSGGGTQPNTFFDMHLNALSSPWPSTVLPTVQIGGIRLWDTGTGWAEINVSAATCDFSRMDSWVTEAEANNADVLYNLARTPTWASSGPTDTSCAYNNIAGGPGQCHPPTDLNDDGSGSDSIFIGWVTSVVSRYAGHIKYYEIWNEWNVPLFWVGTPQQLARMTQDARCVIEGPPSGASCNSNSTFPNGTGLDPSAKVVTPSPVGAQSQLDAVQKNMTTFLSAQAGGVGPGSFSDIIGFHCYVSTQTLGDYPVPEDVVIVDNDLNSALQAFPEVSGKPSFCTEGGWGKVDKNGFADADLQAAFLSRYYLLQYPLGIARVYWYVWDSQSSPGSLWTAGGGATKAATAYGEIHKWIDGATPGSCSQTSGTTRWTCTSTRPGYNALAVWDANSACYVNGTPTCSNFTIPSGYTRYRDLSGNESPVPLGSISLSAKPILLESGPLP